MQKHSKKSPKNMQNHPKKVRKICKINLKKSEKYAKIIKNLENMRFLWYNVFRLNRDYENLLEKVVKIMLKRKIYDELLTWKNDKRISNDRETLIWFDENINSMLKDVQSALNVGDYASASNIAIQHIGDIYSHTELRCRIQTYDEYLSVVKSIQERSDLTYQQKQEWFETYTYKFVPFRNDEGNVIGAPNWINIGGPNNTNVFIP